MVYCISPRHVSTLYRANDIIKYSRLLHRIAIRVLLHLSELQCLRHAEVGSPNNEGKKKETKESLPEIDLTGSGIDIIPLISPF